MSPSRVIRTRLAARSTIGNKVERWAFPIDFGCRCYVVRQRRGRVVRRKDWRRGDCHQYRRRRPAIREVQLLWFKATPFIEMRGFELAPTAKRDFFWWIRQI